MPGDFGAYARLEYERRWLLRGLPPQLDASSPWSRITDHYIDGTRLRVREQRALQKDFVIRKLGQKFPEEPGALDRIVITNIYLNQDEYDALRRLPGRAIVKRAWYPNYDGRRYAVNAFDGPLEGLILAECEYETIEQMRSVPPSPPFLGVEVTMRPEFTGGELIRTTFAQLQPLINSLLASEP